MSGFSRRSFLGILAAVPFVGLAVKKANPAQRKPEPIRKITCDFPPWRRDAHQMAPHRDTCERCGATGIEIVEYDLMRCSEKDLSLSRAGYERLPRIDHRPLPYWSKGLTSTIELRAHNPEEQHMADLLAKAIKSDERRTRNRLMEHLYRDA